MSEAVERRIERNDREDVFASESEDEERMKRWFCDRF